MRAGNGPRRAAMLALAMSRALSIALLAVPVAALADGSMHGMSHPAGNVELFLTLRGTQVTGPASSGETDEDAWALGDLVFAAEHGRWRLMGEYNLSTEEHDFERLQVGYEPVPDTLLWIGRFHQPGSAWNNEFHHGPYLQTAISRPSIEFWEDEEGPIPQHLSGFMGESRLPLGAGAGVRAALGVGYGSSISATGLEPIGVLDSNGSGHHVSITAHVAWLPTYLGQSSAGFLFGHHLSGVLDPGLRLRLGASEVGMSVVGAYVDGVRERDRVLAVVYRIGVDLDAGTGTVGSEHFDAGYLQLEKGLPHALTAYVRHENTASAGSSRYVQSLAEELVLHGTTLGLRLDLPHHQALTVEAGRITEVEGRMDRLRIQWSAALP